MRRKEREITDMEEILAVIDDCRVARIGLSCEEGAYIVPMNFGYEYEKEGGKLFLYFHSAMEGRKADMIKACGAVGFEMDRLIQVVEQEKPCGWTAHYESVIGTGHMRLLESGGEKRHALDAMMHHYGMEGPGDYPDQMLARTAVWELAVKTVAGKRNV